MIGRTTRRGRAAPVDGRVCELLVETVLSVAISIIVLLVLFDVVSP